MSARTPGPWRTSHNRHSGAYVVHDQDGSPIAAHEAACLYNTVLAQRDELAEALRSYLDEHGIFEAGKTGATTGCRCGVCSQARAALAKVRP